LSVANVQLSAIADNWRKRAAACGGDVHASTPGRRLSQMFLPQENSPPRKIFTSGGGLGATLVSTACRIQAE